MATHPPARPPSDTELLSTLFELGREVMSVLDLEELLAEIPQLIARLTRFNAFSVYLLDEPRQELRIYNPTLPAWLGEVVLERFRVGKTLLKLRFSRTGASCAVEVLEQNGDPIRVTVELSPNA